MGLSQYLALGNIESSYTNWFKFTGDISGGMSGGPVMLTDSNKIVGLTSEKFLFQEASRGWRVTNDLILLIIDIRNSST